MITAIFMGLFIVIGTPIFLFGIWAILAGLGDDK